MTSAMVLVTGLLVALVGLVGLARGRIVRLRVRNRTGAALVAAAGMVLALAAGASSPTAPDAQASASGGIAAATPPSASARRTGALGDDPAHQPSAPSELGAEGGHTAGEGPRAKAVGHHQAGRGAGDHDARRRDRGRGPRHPSRQGPGTADRLRPRAVRPGLGRHRPQRLRHPQRHPAPRPDRPPCSEPAPTAASSSAARSPTPTPARRSPSCAAQATSSRVQIDHVVALSDAWQKGAQQWTTPTRTRFANDPLNLLAVDGPTNQRKSDGDAATWLPPRTSYRCAYVARQTAVKARYGLWVTAAEKDAVRRVLDHVPRPTGADGVRVRAPRRRPHGHDGPVADVPRAHPAGAGAAPATAGAPRSRPPVRDLPGGQRRRLRSLPLRRGRRVRLVPRPGPRRRGLRAVTPRTPGSLGCRHESGRRAGAAGAGPGVGLGLPPPAGAGPGRRARPGRARGVVIADTRAALRVLETSHPPTYYLPVADFRPGALRPAPGGSLCEWKGEASYVDLLGGDAVAARAGWYYPTPTAAYAALATTWRCTPARSTRARSTARWCGPSPATSTAAGSPTGSWGRSRESRAPASGDGARGVY